MDFTQVLNNFADKIANSLPNIVGALIVLLIGWLIAKGIKKLVVNLLNRTSWHKKVLSDETDGETTNNFIATLLYYLIMIIVFLIVLEILGITSVLEPLERMVDKFLAFIPHLFAAGIIAFVGYMIAKFVSSLVGTGGKFIGKLVEKTGIKNTDQVVTVIKNFVFIIIFIPLLIQAINALELDSIGDPLNAILSGFIGIIGNIIVAAVILGIFIWGGKYLADFLAKLFQNLGLDNMSEKLQLNTMLGAKSLSKLVANVLYFFIIFFGVITALQTLQLERLTEILNEILDITGSIAFGALILVIGNFIAYLIYNMMTGSNKNKFVAQIVRAAIIALFLGMSLRAMGFANEIVELAFGLTLGAIAVVVALSYGLGGREAAGEHFKEIIQKLKGKDSDQL